MKYRLRFIFWLLGVLISWHFGPAAFAQETQIPIEIRGPERKTKRPLNQDDLLGERARSSEMRGDFDRAVKLWEELLSRDPWNRSAIEAIPRDLLILQRPDEAEAFLRRWISKDAFRPFPVTPGDPTSSFSLRLGLGQVELARENENGAWDIWNAALDEAGRTPETMRALVNALQLSRRWEDSERVIRDYRKQANDPAFMALELALSLQGQMNFAAAAEELLLFAQSSPARWQTASSYLNRFPTDSTVVEKVNSVLRKAVKRERRSAELHRILAGWAHRVGNLQEFLDATIVADSLAKDGGTQVVIAAEQLLREEAVERAQAGFRKALAWDIPPDVAARAELGLGRCLEHGGEWAEAKAAYQNFIARHSTFREADQAKFRIADIQLQRESDPAEALVTFRGLWTKPPRELGVPRAEVGLKIGDCHAWMSEFEPAISAWNEVARMDRGDGEEASQALLRVARANLWRDSSDAALEALDKITAGDPTNTAFNDAVLYTALIEEGGVFRATRAFAEADYANFRHEDSLAAERFSESAGLLKFGKLAEWALFSQALALRECGRALEAVAALDTFIVKYRESVDLDRAKYTRAVILMDDLQDNEAALSELEQFLIDHPRSIYLEQARRRARMLTGKVS
ncbi:MAG: tetratricopeptide repeat protein [bacterium]|nr:tetratricopeptide repeat protein [bacterium]